MRLMNKKILTLILVSALLVSGFSLPASARAAALLRDCSTVKPDFKHKNIQLDAPDISLSFRVEFEKARNQYHKYMNCVFNGQVANILGSSGADTSGIFSANAPLLPELLKPESACLQASALALILNDSSPETLLQPMLTLYTEYSDHLTRLLYQSNQQTGSGSSGQVDIQQLVSKNQFFGLLVDNEIQNAIMALDSAFNEVKNLRQAFILHVHFQCMLKNLEHYRRALENLRNTVILLPSLLVNASMHK
jgi:hypothetical protein